MRIKILITIALVSAISMNAFGKSKFDRTKKTNSKADSKSDSKPESKPDAKPDSKVDISDLENRYWTAKDTEFSVVQNRVYTKAKKFSVTPMIGTIFNDPYTNSTNIGVAANYYFSERTGVELTYWKTSASEADLISRIGSNGAVPDHNLPQSFIGAAYNWIPIYAKLSLLEQKILYFDMSVSPGIGVTTLNSSTYQTSTAITPPPSKAQSPITFSLDVAQQVFLSAHWAIKLDIRNHFYQEQLYGAVSGAALSNKFTYTGAAMLGVTYFQ